MIAVPGWYEVRVVVGMCMVMVVMMGMVIR